MDIRINELIQQKKYVECISMLREHTKLYSLIELLCEHVVNDDYIEKPDSFWDDYAIVLFYLGKKKEAYACYNNILKYQKTNLQEYNVNHFKNNMKYSQNDNIIKRFDLLNYLQSIKITEITDDIKDVNGEYQSFNPSIVKTSNGYICNIRKSNYKFDENYKYITSGLVSTKNDLIYYDTDFKIKNAQRINDCQMPYPGNFDGFEDIRLFYYNEKLHCSFSTLSATPDRKQHICMCDLESNTKEYILLNNYGNGQIQKNWVPLVNNNNLYFIYSFFPLTVLKYDDNIKNVVLHQCSTSINNVWRGGSCAISLSEIGYDGYYLCCIHESYFPQYYHRFVLLKMDNNILNIINYSPQFCFIDNIVEFCAGIAISHDKKDLVMSFGKMDRHVYLASVDINIIISSLIDPKLIIIPKPLTIKKKLDSPYTFVTCFFNLEKLENKIRHNHNVYVEKSKFLLTKKVNLVFYSDDDDMIENVLKIREPYKDMTKIIKMNIEDLPYYKHYDHINNIRMSNDFGGLTKNKDTALFTLLVWSKFYFLKQSQNENYFNTNYMMWIDFGLSYIATHNDFIDSFNHKSEKILAECINLPTSEIINKIHSKNTFLCYLGCGLFGGNNENVLKLCDKFDECLNELLISNDAPLEEGIMSYIAFFHNDMFEYYYGDYVDMIDNRVDINSAKNIKLIMRNLDVAMINNIDNVACDIIKKLLVSYYEGRIELNDETYLKLLKSRAQLFYSKTNMYN